MSSLISVIMTTYNSEKTVDVAIQSILKQTFSDFEFLICDDGSTDSTFKILENYAELDSRIKVIKNKKNLGLTKSLNKLIDLCCGDYIVRQDSDDYSNPERLKYQLDKATLTNCDVVFSRAKTIDTNKLIPGISYFLPYKLVVNFKNPFIHGTLFISSTILKKIKYDENFYFAQDYKLYFDLINKKVKIKKIFNTLYFLNTENNISSKYKFEQKYYANCARSKTTPKEYIPNV